MPCMTQISQHFSVALIYSPYGSMLTYFNHTNTQLALLRSVLKCDQLALETNTPGDMNLDANPSQPGL
jgi:hypothetical protein